MNQDPIKKEITNNFYDIIIIGGGLAGLVSSILLSRKGFKTLLLEKNSYPFHKVCGEYVSNEVLEFLNSIGFDPFHFSASRIDKLRISDPSGKNIFVNLDMGGFGISRFTMDHALSNIAAKSGVNVLQNYRVSDIVFTNNSFIVSTSDEIFHSHLVIGSYGKRDVLDKKLGRKFILKHTGYLGVKYHVRIDYPDNEIGLDNFPGGYCGIVKIEDDKYNLCYLYKRKKADEIKSVRELEEKTLFLNPVIRDIFEKAVFLPEFPKVINEIFFDDKPCIEGNILFCGDSAGLITPLCGNGMAMAIHAAKILSGILIGNSIPGQSISQGQRTKIENVYKNNWNSTFSNRLFWGRTLQKISGNPFLTSAALKIIHSNTSLENWLINKTHGEKLIS